MGQKPTWAVKGEGLLSISSITWPSRKIRILLFLLWQMIAEPPLDGGQVRDLTEPVSPRGKKQEGIRKRRHEAGAGHPLKRGE